MTEVLNVEGELVDTSKTAEVIAGVGPFETEVQTSDQGRDYAIDVSQGPEANLVEVARDDFWRPWNTTLGRSENTPTAKSLSWGTVGWGTTTDERARAFGAPMWWATDGWHKRASLFPELWYGIVEARLWQSPLMPTPTHYGSANVTGNVSSISVTTRRWADGVAEPIPANSIVIAIVYSQGNTGMVPPVNYAIFRTLTGIPAIWLVRKTVLTAASPNPLVFSLTAVNPNPGAHETSVDLIAIANGAAYLEGVSGGGGSGANLVMPAWGEANHWYGSTHLIGMFVARRTAGTQLVPPGAWDAKMRTEAISGTVGLLEMPGGPGGGMTIPVSGGVISRGLFVPVAAHQAGLYIRAGSASGAGVQSLRDGLYYNTTQTGRLQLMTLHGEEFEDGDVMRVSYDRKRIKVFRNGVLVTDYTNDVMPSGVLPFCGMYSLGGGGEAAWDDFRQYTLARPPWYPSPA